MSHTPGPWRKGERDTVICDSPDAGVTDVMLYGGEVIALVTAKYREKISLMSAAPDLYEACKAYLNARIQIAIELDGEPGLPKPESLLALKKALAGMEEAIRRAEGHAD